MAGIVNKIYWAAIITFKQNNSLNPLTKNNNNFQMSLLELVQELDILLWDRMLFLCVPSHINFW